MVHGIALGDALGAPVEKLSADEIARLYGRVTSLDTRWHKADEDAAARNHRIRGHGIVTDDTLMTLCLMEVYGEVGRHLDAWDMAGPMVRRIAWEPVWIPEMEREAPLIERLFYPEKWIFARLQLAACDPRQGGVGNMVNCGAAMYVAPVGVVNAGDPGAAYDEAVAFAAGHQQSYGLEAAGVMAACVAAAFSPGASIDDVVGAALALAKDGTRAAIDAAVSHARELRAAGTGGLEAAHALQDALRPYSPMGDDVRHGPGKAGVATAAYQPSRLLSIEELPLALGFAVLNGGDFRATIEDGVNSGRDTDSIGVMAGAILGALHGEDVIRPEDAATLDRANRLDLRGAADAFHDAALCILRDDTREADALAARRRALLEATSDPSTDQPMNAPLTASPTTQGALTPDDILLRIYAGIIGKMIGVRLGAPVEPTIWSYERIRGTYGEVTGYLRDFRTFAADDDTNGPLYFIRVLRDYGLGAGAPEMGRTWLNYAAEEHGMYWWGGFNRSTEHTAWANLRAGIPAPRSGSIAQNGAAVAEQIGGQIFIDSWGWVHPGDPARAAEASATAASVAHDGNGLEGSRFVAAAIAAAFTAGSLREAFDAALGTLDPRSTYAAVACAVATFHVEHPDDWRACRDMLAAEWGYDRYPGVCHIIPNAGILVMALLYGNGDLNRTVEIATMAGWDTDCNAGNAGAIVGTLQGLQPHWDKYRAPINDLLIASGVLGTLNIADVPIFARELATLALRLRGEPVPPAWEQDWERKGVRFDWALPGSTHGFRAAATNATQVVLKGSTPGNGPDGGGALEILLDRMERDEPGRVFWKPFLRRSDFEDERYRPMLTPVVADGQRVSFRLRLDPWEGDGHLRVAPYVRRSLSGRIEETGAWHVPPTHWSEVAFDIPDGGGDPVDEVGLRVEYFGRVKFLGRLFLADFRVGGPGRRVLDPARLVEEWGTILGCTWNRGRWTLEEGCIQGHTATDADLWTGHHNATDQRVTARLTPLAGRSHLVALRVQGTARFYAAGFQDGELVLLREDFGTEVLARAPCEAPMGEEREVVVEAVGDRLTARVGGGPAVEASCGRFRYGMAGLRMAGPGRMRVARLEVEELA